MASLREAARFVRQLTTNCNIHPSKIPIYFSGKRGFHVTVDHTLLRMSPATTNRHIVGFFARQMKYIYQLESLDLEIYRKSQYMLRVVDSINSETGRFCIQLSLEEALKIDYPGLMSLASKPRGVVYTPRKDEFTPGGFSDAWGAIERQYERLDSLAKLRPIKPIDKDMLPPECHDSLSQMRLNNPSQVEAAIIALAAFDKDQGVAKEESVKGLIETLVPKNSTDDDRKISEAIIRSIVDEVYGSDSYHFSCAYIRSLGNDDQTSMQLCEDDEWCEQVSIDDQEIANPPLIPLDKAMNPRWRGQKILVSATLSGITSKPRGAPRTLQVKCKQPNMKICDKCPVSTHPGGRMVKRIAPHDKILLMCVNINENMRDGKLKEWLQIPKSCHVQSIKVLDEFSTYDLTLIPTLRAAAEAIDEDIPYVSRAAMLVDPGDVETIRMEASKEYVLTVYPWTNPVFPDIILQIVDARPKENSIEQFKMSRELHESLKVFQVREGQSVRDKLLEIYEDLSANALHIYSRFDMFLCYDIVFHSLTANFRFGEDKVDRAYCESLVIGDTGEGKTALARRMIGHYGLGFFCSGETARRTGLLYTVHQPIGKEWMIQWGVLPINDKRLVVIDEFSGVSNEDKESLTSVRSSGIVTVSQAAKGSAQARTRVIYLTNSPDSKFVNQHNFGCEIVPKVFRKPEDIRRLDIANTLSNNDLDQDEINRKLQSTDKPEHKYTAQLCNGLLLWIWSRGADQVEFTEECKRDIFTAAKYLSTKYDHELPLLQARDLPFKLARLTAAVAARTYSTRDGEVLICGREHIQAVKWMIDFIYSKKSFGFLSKSVIAQNARRKTLEHLEEVKTLIRTKFSSNGNLASFCDNLLDTRTFTKKDISEFAGNMEGFDEFFSVLRGTRMIEREGQYWVLGEHFKDMIKEVLSDVTWEQGEADDAAEAQPEPAGAESAEVADLFGESASD